MNEQAKQDVKHCPGCGRRIPASLVIPGETLCGDCRQRRWTPAELTWRTHEPGSRAGR